MRYIFKDGEMHEYSDYVRKYGLPETRGNTGGTTIINKSFDAYESPSSGKVISSHAERNDDLARSGCVEYDPDIKQDYQRNIAEGEAEMDKCVDSHVDAEWAKMSTQDKVALFNTRGNYNTRVSNICYH